MQADASIEAAQPELDEICVNSCVPMDACDEASFSDTWKYWDCSEPVMEPIKFLPILRAPIPPPPPRRPERPLPVRVRPLPEPESVYDIPLSFLFHRSVIKMNLFFLFLIVVLLFLSTWTLAHIIYYAVQEEQRRKFIEFKKKAFS